VELELRQVRAFVAAAEHGHFGRASQSLFLTQQALSKRIAGLEAQLGVMFERGPSGVSLTERGERFLPAAYRLLEAAGHATAAGRGDPPSPLRVDVWGPIDPVESTVRAFAAERSQAIVEVSMRRNLPAALAAVARNELDVAVGNLANLVAPVRDGLSNGLVAVTEAAALVYERSRLAREDTITPDELRRHGLAVPIQDSRREFEGFVTEYAESFDVPLSTDVRNTDLDGLVDRISADPGAVTLVPAGWPLPENRGLRLVPIRPAPFFPWYATWRTATAHPLVPRLIQALHDGGGSAALENTEHWLPQGARDWPASRSDEVTVGSVRRSDRPPPR
jgi:DNA-binding transcriptional LysR family regulator